MTEDERLVVMAAMNWTKHICKIGKVSTDAPYHSLQLRNLFAACERLAKARKSTATATKG